MDARVPEGITTRVERDRVSATAVVKAPPEEILEFLRRPANHALISGDQSVRGTTTGPERLSLGDRFGMQMRMLVPYRITSKVVELDENRCIAWCHVGGHRWRWEVEPAGEGASAVTETFDMSTARFPPALRLMGYPKRHERNVATSVARVAAHFAGTDNSHSD